MLLDLLLAAAAAAAPAGASPTAAQSPAEDVAEISNTACLAWAAGQLNLPHPAAPEHDAAVDALGLKGGIASGTLDMFGAAGFLINRAQMAHRANGESQVVLAFDGALPGCRVILLGDASAGAAEAVKAALLKPAFGGWTGFPDMSETRGPITKHVFLRRDGSGKPYLLNLVVVSEPIGSVQLYTNVVAVPPAVALPPGF